MSSKKLILIFLCFSTCLLLNAQDGKLSWYYPKLDDVDPRTGKKSSFQLNTHDVSGCVSGNCKSGNGEYLIAIPDEDTVVEFMGIIPVVKLTLFKGVFSNDGNNFEGTVYSRKVNYDVEYKKDVPRLVPKEKADLRNESFWKPFEVASGTMVKAGSRNYNWNGWMQQAQQTDNKTGPGEPTSFKAH